MSNVLIKRTSQDQIKGCTHCLCHIFLNVLPGNAAVSSGQADSTKAINHPQINFHLQLFSTLDLFYGYKSVTTVLVNTYFTELERPRVLLLTGENYSSSAEKKKRDIEGHKRRPRGKQDK